MQQKREFSEREFFKYLPSLPFQPYQEKDNPTSSADFALTAFAQLGALRLKASRSFISLFDKTHQYILAEATPTLSLVCDDIHETGDRLWFGSTVIHRHAGPCSIMVEERVRAHNDATDAVTVISDLADLHSFQGTEFASKTPKPRFYAGLPLQTPRGVIIGAYCVIDDKPRDTLGPAEIRFLHDMGATVMSHLVLSNMREEYRQGERMIRGLGSFVEGKATLRNWRATTGSDEISYAPSRTHYGGEGQLDGRQQLLQTQRHTHQRDTPNTRPDAYGSRKLGEVAPADLSHVAIPSAQHLRPSSTNNDQAALLEGSAPSDSHVPVRVPDDSRSASYDNRAPAFDATLSHNTAPAIPQTIPLTLSRAANVIRECLEVEGAVFYNSGVSAYDRISLDPQKSDSRAEATSTDETSRYITTGSDTATNVKRRAECSIAAHSETQTSSINDGAPSSTLEHFPAKFLQSLFRRFPKGKIFHIDVDGVLSAESSGSAGSSEEKPLNESADKSRKTSGGSLSQAGGPRKRGAIRPQDGTLLQTHFPGARSIGFFPLWDSNREKWFAGGFIWTKRPNRSFTVEGQMSFLGAMGSSVMAETARLDALVSDRAKTNFLGLVSHELRSPLHGILGSAELLSSSLHDDFHTDMLRSIETCGRTLLDTIEQLLDFSKINHLAQQKRQTMYEHPRDRPTPGALHKDPAKRLDILTEEVVAAVAAGHDAQRRITTKLTEGGRSMTDYGITTTAMPGTNTNEGRLASSFDDERVAVILDIDRSMSMLFHVSPGAWKRIVMNLFANSLKYTKSGHVLVSLSARPLRKKQHGSNYKIYLTVSDTGQGISASYLRESLFSPFSQEDDLASGTGLGLNIVKQIVDSYKGRINVRSTQDVGTKISVSMCVEIDVATDPGIESDPIATRTESIALRSHGKLACLLSASVGTNNSRRADDGRLELEATLRKTCRDWFGITFLTDHEIGIHACDIFFAIEPEPSQLEACLKNMLQLASPSKPPGKILLFIMCRSLDSEKRIIAASNEIYPVAWIVQCIIQPCGTHKLARHIANGFDLQSSNELPVPQSHSVSSDSGEVESDPSLFLPSEDLMTPTTSGADDLSVRSQRTEEFDAKLPPSKGSLNVTDGSIVTLTASSTPVEEQSQEHHQASTRPAHDDMHIKPTTFLLVDDNVINVKILVAFMKRRNASSLIAENGLEALRMYTSDPAACRTVVMDISMPVMDGLASTRAIRSLEKQRRLEPSTIVIVTGLADANVQEEAKASGADAYLAKPVNFKELDSILTQLGR